MTNETIKFPVFVQVGSSTESKNPNDYDILAVENNIDFKTIEFLKRQAAFYLNKKGITCLLSLIELRHGPFKIQNESPQIHLLIHTPETLRNVSLMTRMRWYETAGWSIRIKSIKNLLLPDTITVKSIFYSLIYELERLALSLNTMQIFYQHWKYENGSKKMNLVAEHCKLKTEHERNVFVHHIKSLLRYYINILNKSKSFLNEQNLNKLSVFEGQFKIMNDGNLESMNTLINYLLEICRSI